MTPKFTKDEPRQLVEVAEGEELSDIEIGLLASDKIYVDKRGFELPGMAFRTMDIRKVLSDNAIKDMLADEDTKFIRAVSQARSAKNDELWSSFTKE